MKMQLYGGAQDGLICDVDRRTKVMDIPITFELGLASQFTDVETLKTLSVHRYRQGIRKPDGI